MRNLLIPNSVLFLLVACDSASDFKSDQASKTALVMPPGAHSGITVNILKDFLRLME